MPWPNLLFTYLLTYRISAVLAVTMLSAELRVESSSVIRSATSVCPDLAMQLIIEAIDEQMKQSPQPELSSKTI